MIAVRLDRCGARRTVLLALQFHDRFATDVMFQANVVHNFPKISSPPVTRSGFIALGTALCRVQQTLRSSAAATVADQLRQCLALLIAVFHLPLCPA